MVKAQWTGVPELFEKECIHKGKWHDSASHDQPKALCAAEKAGGHWRRAVGDSLAQSG